MQRAFLLMILFLSFNSYSQNIENERMIVNDFDFAMKDIKSKLISDGNFTAKQRRLLIKVKETLDSSIESFDITSNSDTKIITYNKYAWIAIYRFLISKEISKTMIDRDIESDFTLDGIDYNRNNFYNFYNYFLKWLPENIDVIQQAELNDVQLESLQSYIEDEPFKFSVKRLIVLIYLHEFYHQVQEVNRKKQNIYKLNSSQTIKDSLYLNLEKECDSFALFKAYDIRILPENYIETFDVINSFKHNRSAMNIDILKRKIFFYQKLYDAKDVFNEPYLRRYDLPLLIQIINNTNRELNSVKNVSLSLTQFKNTANKDNDIEKYFSLGYLYLVDNPSISVKNIDSSLVYFEKAAKINIGTNNTLLSIQERSLLSAGKIYEIVKKDKKMALQNYIEASKIAIYFPKEFYVNLRKRLSTLN